MSIAPSETTTEKPMLIWSAVLHHLPVQCFHKNLCIFLFKMLGASTLHTFPDFISRISFAAEEGCLKYTDQTTNDKSKSPPILPETAKATVSTFDGAGAGAGFGNGVFGARVGEMQLPDMEPSNVCAFSLERFITILDL